MEKYLIIVEANCSEPEKEAEFNEWYDTVHVPDILDEPLTIGVSRWVDIDAVGERGKYYTLIEIETEDIERTLELQKDAIERLQAADRLSDLMLPVSRHILKKIGP